MSGQTRTTLLAALAVLLTSAALGQVYADSGWLPPSVLVVALVAASGWVGRRLRVPALLQPALAVLVVGEWLALRHGGATLTLGVVPTAETAREVGALLGQGLVDVEEQSAPVRTTPGLVLLGVLGLAAVATAVDLAAVTLRRPAVAGLPLLALVAVPSGTLEGGVGWWPFALGAAGWLLLLMDDAGARVTRWGSTLRASRSGSPVDPHLGRVGRRIGVAAVGVAVVVPALVPGMESRLLVNGGGGSGFGGARTTVTYNPLTELAGQLRLPDPRPLLVYRTSDPDPDYLRLTTLDRFDPSSGWSSSELSADVRRDNVSRGIPSSSALQTAATQPVNAAIRVQQLGGPWLPVPPVPTEVDIDGPWLWDSDSETVFSTRVDLGDVDDAYRVSASRLVPDAASLRASGRVPDDIAPFAVAPEVSPYVADLTAEVVEGVEPGYDQVAALQAFFRSAENGFEYSEDTAVPSIDSPDALEAFLRGRRGFCEQYASAMAAMVRVLGVPARVAVGFTPGTAADDGTRQVTTDDAHAWPEVWFADAGWVRFEPTPRGEQVRTPAYSVPPSEEEAPDVPQPAATTAPPVATPAPTDPGATDGGPQDPAAGAGGDDGPGVLTPARVGGGAVAVALLVAPAALAALRRRRLWREPGPTAAWAHVVEDAADVGHRWRAADSPRTAADRLVAERDLADVPAHAVRRLAERLEHDRYARPGAVEPAAEQELRADVAEVRAGLLATAPTRTRWAARLFPASALRWARTGAAERLADAFDRVDDVLAAVGDRIGRLRRGSAG